MKKTNKPRRDSVSQEELALLFVMTETFASDPVYQQDGKVVLKYFTSTNRHWEGEPVGLDRIVRAGVLFALGCVKNLGLEVVETISKPNDLATKTSLTIVIGQRRTAKSPS
jgi:hypothetical protein